MTKPQESFYWRRWAAVARANGWRMVKGALASAPGQGTAEHSQWHAVVWIAANALAKRHGCNVRAEELRHACHIVATAYSAATKATFASAPADPGVLLSYGRVCGHADLTPDESDCLASLFTLLIEPDNLDAVLVLESAELRERRRLVWRIQRQAPTAYIVAVCRDKFGAAFKSPHWQELPIAELRELHLTLRMRTKGFESPIRATNMVPAQTGAEPECPF